MILQMYLLSKLIKQVSLFIWSIIFRQEANE